MWKVFLYLRIRKAGMLARGTLAGAIMDRLVSNANKIELKGESMRQEKKK